MADSRSALDVLSPIGIGLAAGTALSGFALYFWMPPPALPEALHYLLQGLGGAAGGWCGHHCGGLFE